MPRLARCALVAVSALTAGACAQALRNMNGEEDPDRKWVVAAAGVAFKCARTNVVAVEDGEYKRDGFPWSITACGQKGVCRQVDDAAAIESWECGPPPPFKGKPMKPGDDGYPGVEAALFGLAGCPDRKPQVWLLDKERRGVGRIGATLCGRDFDCIGEVSRKNDLTDDNTKCTETDASLERTERKVVVDRLALETGCSNAQISITSATEWRRGSERGYRLAACDRSFICTTAAGRTDCKVALDQPTLVVVDAGVSVAGPADAG